MLSLTELVALPDAVLWDYHSSLVEDALDDEDFGPHCVRRATIEAIINDRHLVPQD